LCFPNEMEIIEQEQHVPARKLFRHDRSQPVWL
jgi:hypothetical protein